MIIGLALFVLAILASFAGSIVKGWALSKLWVWFVMPLFPVPALTIVQSIGLVLVINFIMFTSTDTKLADIHKKIMGTEDESFGELLTKTLKSTLSGMFVAVMVVGLGWLWLQVL